MICRSNNKKKKDYLAIWYVFHNKYHLIMKILQIGWDIFPVFPWGKKKKVKLSSFLPNHSASLLLSLCYFSCHSIEVSNKVKNISRSL